MLYELLDDIWALLFDIDFFRTLKFNDDKTT